MAYPKGAPKPEGSGRKKGTPNKITQTMRDAMYEAFEEAGGVVYLVKLAEEDPKTFSALLGKLIPSEIKAEVETRDVTEPDYSKLTKDELKTLAELQEKADGPG